LVSSNSSKDSAVENAHQRLSLRRDRDATLKQGSGSDATVVHLLVGISSFDHSTALERDTSEQTLGFAVCENTGDTLERCCTSSFGIATNGTGSDGNVSSESDTASLGKGANSSSVIENEDKVGKFETDLTTKTTTNGTDCRGSGPES